MKTTDPVARRTIIDFGPHGNSIKYALLTLLLIFLLPGNNFVDPDLWHGISLIRESVVLGRIPLEDRFAYTPTVYPVVHHEWAIEGVIYCISTRFGAAGILALKYLIVILIGAGAFLLARRNGASLGMIVLLAPIAIPMVGTGLSTIRAQVFTILFLVVLLHAIEADRRGSRRWILPWLVVHLIWLNSHAGFVVGGLLLFAHGLEQFLRGRPVKHLLAVGIAMVSLVALNPYGLAYYSYLSRAIPMDRSLIDEWGPIWRESPYLLMVYAISLLLLGYSILQRGIRATPGLLVLLPAAGAALVHMRHLELFAVIWFAHAPAFLSGTRLQGVLGRIVDRVRLKPIVAWSIVIVIATSLAPIKKPWTLLMPANPGDHPRLLYPIGAIDRLAEIGFQGNLMTPFHVGAFTSWKLHPKVKVSLDGRFEVAYPPSALAEQFDFYAGRPGWKEMLAKYPTDAVLVLRSAKVVPLLRDESGWRLAYEDDAYLIFARPELPLPYKDRRGERLAGTFP
jgi:hypothetical protein